MQEIKVKKLREHAKLPVYATADAAAADLCSAEAGPVTVAPGETVVIHTGIAVELPSGFAGFVYARSGLATKRGLAPANKVGVSDADHRGEILVSLHNHSAIPATLEPGERIAQLLIAPAPQFSFTEVPELSDTVRGTGGFGSTGRK